MRSPHRICVLRDWVHVLICREKAVLSAIAKSAKAGQSLIESCLVIALICLIFMGLFQVSQLFAAREILYHAAARGARAKTVGFNWWMVEKAVHVASIPNAGKMIEPEFENEDLVLQEMVRTLRPGELWSYALGAVPSSLQYNIERARIPEYLASHNQPRSRYILDYSDWDSIRFELFGFPPPDPDIANLLVHIRVTQDYPLRAALHRTFYAADTVTLEADSYLENHYPLYIDDMYW